MPPVLPADARNAVLAWFDERGRDLAFRRTRDPYAILVSEVMAQQTQIGRVVPAWSRFIERFPTVAVLAAASPADVLRAWRGMGYDRRALNLLRAARVIVADHRGEVPRDLDALQRLPGIGPYTARAIASIAFGAPVGAVDTNVRRVLQRSLSGGVEMTPRDIQVAADESVHEGRPGDWTHALMDIGATICRPGRPRCDECPLRPWCLVAAHGWQPRPSNAWVGGHPPTKPFERTTRWLRGRIVDRLRETDDLAWLVVDGPIGHHDSTAIEAALAALFRDGIVELDATVASRARLASD
jgi:A/G-specific adenine glycosylase